MHTPEGAGAASYLVPSRTISGSPEEMLAQLDEAVQGLLALRHLIAVQRGTGSPRVARGAQIKLVTPEHQPGESANR